MEAAFAGHDLQDVKLHPDERLLDLEYAGEIAIIGDSYQTCQAALDRLTLTVNGFELCFAPSKCEVLQAWQGPTPALPLVGDQLEVAPGFTYLGSYIIARRIEDEVRNRIAKARGVFADLRHVWRRRDITTREEQRL